MKDPYNDDSQARALRSRSKHLRILGVRIDTVSRCEALASILRGAAQPRCQVVNFANAHCLNTARSNSNYRRALADSDLVLSDGSGVHFAARIQGRHPPQNLNGTDLFPAICEAAAAAGVSIFLLGARPGIAAATATAMQADYPNLLVAGSRDGYFDSAQEDALIADINASGAGILFVAMGVPQQELWLQRVAPRLHLRTALGVGGLFDFYSGRIARAPLLLRHAGLEWCWRLAQEPKRMWRRYLLGNPLFLFRVIAERINTNVLEVSPRYLQLRRHLTRLQCWQSDQRHRVHRSLIRLSDITAAGVALLALTPLMAAVAAAIRIESSGSVLFAQTRIGENGKPFKFWKFRSMYTDAEARRQQLFAGNEMAGGVIFKIKKDPRITRVGRFIRRFSIDELPQLWNVLRGDMALVGPRPPLPDEVAQYTSHDRVRLLGKPGITCVWQVSGRSDIPFATQVRMDVDYLHRASLSNNLRLLAKTVPAVLGGRGAY